MIIFVGDKPSKRMKPGAKPFEGAACERRVKSWINTLTRGGDDQYLIINQCDYEFINFVAMVRRDGHRLIALGNNASKAISTVDHFKLPHPSGRNRQINDKAFISKRLNECREWLRK
jgi:hypothetical protein